MKPTRSARYVYGILVRHAAFLAMLVLVACDPVAATRPLSAEEAVDSENTQVPARFNEFVKRLIDLTFTRDSELRVIDTICHDIRKRQTTAVELANRVDLMLVVGGHASANAKRLAELCSNAVTTYLIETAGELQSSWFEGKKFVGITGGASTPDKVIDEVVLKMEAEF